MSRWTRCASVLAGSGLARALLAVGCCWAVFLATLTPVCGQTAALAKAPTTKQKIFLIGNSLTWDTVPALLSGDVAWHVDCGKSLQFIYDHPSKPCVPTSKLWPDALRNVQYDFLCVQPHFGTTLNQDVEVIDKWLELQPRAVLVLHTGWARHAEVEKEFHVPPGSIGVATNMVHAPEYYQALERALIARHPKLEVRSTKVMQAIDSIGHDIERKSAPLGSLAELYRDEIHLTVQGGRYLAHNMLRRALGQPLSSQGFQLEPDLQNYLDQKINQIRQ